MLEQKLETLNSQQNTSIRHFVETFLNKLFINVQLTLTSQFSIFLLFTGPLERDSANNNIFRMHKSKKKPASVAHGSILEDKYVEIP